MAHTAAAAPARVDVLAVMRKAASKATNPVNASLMNDAFAAVETLIEAAKKAQAMMATPDRIEPRHRQELSDAIARCEMPRDPRIAALAQVSP